MPNEYSFTTEHKKVFLDSLLRNIETISQNNVSSGQGNDQAFAETQHLECIAEGIFLDIGGPVSDETGYCVPIAKNLKDKDVLFRFDVLNAALSPELEKDVSDLLKTISTDSELGFSNIADIVKVIHGDEVTINSLSPDSKLSLEDQKTIQISAINFVQSALDLAKDMVAKEKIECGAYLKEIEQSQTKAKEGEKLDIKDKIHLKSIFAGEALEISPDNDGLRKTSGIKPSVIISNPSAVNCSKHLNEINSLG